MEQTLTFLTDKKRHLICQPYSVKNLHRMAEILNIHRGWFHRNHYDIPKQRIAEIESKCSIVSSREIVAIIRAATKPIKNRSEERFELL